MNFIKSWFKKTSSFDEQPDNKIHPLRVYDKYQWFISYQSTDALIARHLAEFLIAENKSVWFGEYFICSEDWFNEDHFMNEIRNGIDNSEAGIMLTNKRYWASKYCLEEKERLIDKIHKDKRILIAPSGDQSQIIKDLISTGINFIPFEPAQLEAGRFIGHSLLQKTITDPTRSEQKFPHRINYKGHGYLIDIEGWKTVSHGEKKHRDDGNLFGPEFERTFSKTSCHLKIMIGDQVIQSRPPVEIEIEEAKSSVKYLATHMKYGKTFNQYLHNVTDPDRLVYQIALIWALEFAQEAKEQIVGVHLLSVNGHSQFAATSRTQKGTYYRRYSIVIPETDQKKGNAEVLFTFHFKGTNFQDFCRYAFLMDRMVLSLQHQQPSSERTNASPFMKAGRTQMESGRFQEAEESFTKAINVLESAILPEDKNERAALLDLLSGAYLNRAIVRIRLNDPSSAIHDYSKAIANWENLRNQMGDRWPPAFEDNLQRTYRNLQLLKDRIRS